VKKQKRPGFDISDEDLGFSLDDIIAEVKKFEEKERAASAPAEEQEAATEDDIPAPEPIPEDVAAILSAVVPEEKSTERTGEAPAVDVPEEKPESTEDSSAAEETRVIKVPGPDLSSTSRISSDPTAPWRTIQTESPPARKRPIQTHRNYDLVNYMESDLLTASERCLKVVRSMNIRLLIMIPLVLISIYMTLSALMQLPMPFGMRYSAKPFLFLFVLCAAEGLCMLLAGEVTASGLWRLLTLRPTMDSLVLFSCLATMGHAVSIILKPEWGGWLPYCCIGCLICLFALLAKRHRMASMRRTYKAAQFGSAPSAIHCIGDEHHVAFKSSQDDPAPAEELSNPDLTERFSMIYAPAAIIGSLVLAFFASYRQGNPEAFFWSLGAIASAAATPVLLLSSAAPACTVIKKLFASGVALANGKNVSTLSKCHGAVLRDGDIFPPGSVEITGVQTVEDVSPELLCAAVAPLIFEIGGGLAKAFENYVRSIYVTAKPAADVKFYDTGGVSGMVGGNLIMAGTASFIMRQGMRIGESLSQKDAVYIAVNQTYAGMITLSYHPQAQIATAFRLLKREKIKSILALKDFNLNTLVVEESFKLKFEDVEYPELPDRLNLADSQRLHSDNTLAWLSRESMLSFAEALHYSARLRQASLFNLICGIISSVLGILIMFFLTRSAEPAAATPLNALIYQMLWTAPLIISGVRVLL